MPNTDLPGDDLSGQAQIRTFLIADVRGYTLFTQERGDEAAAKLAAKFADIARETVEGRGGTLLELRGDEALCVFASAREASAPRSTSSSGSSRGRSSSPSCRSRSASASTPARPSPCRAGIGAGR